MQTIHRHTLLRLAALLFAATTLAGCSLLKVSVATGDPLSKEQMDVRTMTRGFYYDFSSEVTRAADSVSAASPVAAVRIAAARWKIRSTRAAVQAAMQSIPDVALADLWILCRRMNEAFAVAPDSLLFGAQSDVARAAASRLDGKIARLARRTLAADRYSLMERFVAGYIRENPSSEQTEAANTTLAWLEFLRASGVETSYAVGSISEVLADVNDRLSGQTRQLSNTVGWSKDILEMQLGQDSLRTQIGMRLDSLERSFERIASTAENLPEISSEMMTQFNGQITQLIYTVNASVDNAFSLLDHQRAELQQYLSAERQSLVEQARTAVDEAIQNTLDGIPGLIGKVLLYVVLALVVLIGGPFALGFWLGGVRQRVRERREQKASAGK